MISVKLWGTRGSLAAPGSDTNRYGGNTSCVSVHGGEGTVLVLDAGTGIRRLGGALANDQNRIDLLLTHLHLDHIQGLGFFAPLYQPQREVHIWGPASTTLDLSARLMRYLSPPLFPVHLRDLPCRLELHEVPCGEFSIGEFRILASLVCHPGPTVGYRIAGTRGVVTYLPDHEPALGLRAWPKTGEWVSGYGLARGADLLIHDAQYSVEEYLQRVGWGHSALDHTLAFADLARVRRCVLFHHDPTHSDADIDTLIGRVVAGRRPACEIVPGAEGDVYTL